MQIKTYYHPGGFKYVRVEDIRRTYGDVVTLDFARWCQTRECPYIVGVRAAYYTDFIQFMTERVS